MMSDEEQRVKTLADIFSALGNPLRLKILNIVASSDRPLHIKAVSKMVKTRYPVIYKHVKVLERAGLVKIYEVGRSRVISIRSPTSLERIFLAVEEINK
ncbi:MAG: winged helix-turn-helix domain-containing protein [Nitrososphaerota archaeon]